MGDPEYRAVPVLGLFGYLPHERKQGVFPWRFFLAIQDATARGNLGVLGILSVLRSG